jgi:hypothetical protein
VRSLTIHFKRKDIELESNTNFVMRDSVILIKQAFFNFGGLNVSFNQ